MKDGKRRRMRQCLVLAIGIAGGVAMALTGCGEPDESARPEEASPQYRIFGSIGELVEEGEVKLSRRAGVVGGSEEMMRSPVADGEFELLGRLDWDGVVRLGVSDTEENSKGQVQFILEAGDTRIEYAGAVAGLQADGGPYNQKVIASWRRGEAYQDALAAYRDIMERRKEVEEGDEGFDALRDESWERYRALHEVRTGALRAIAESDEDPLASLYALQLGGMGGEQALSRLDVLQEVLGEKVPLSLPAMRSRIQHGMKLRAAAGAMTEGAQVKGFSSTGLDGVEYRLTDALAGSEYTLIEFWASWCGPCRAENPNLIASYEEYKPKGFEIFAYSLDEDRDDWAEASEEDDIPWINTSDLLAYASPVPGQFGVTAIPMNFLVDSQGVLVAKNLRGEKLDQKLAELIDGISAP